jgi:hypothetical protein
MIRLCTLVLCYGSRVFERSKNGIVKPVMEFTQKVTKQGFLLHMECLTIFRTGGKESEEGYLCV